ncbi:outer membrane protein assembly factor BamD [Marivirga arenosa]|jgi:outer membrane protein assembly factor BamD|uniref:Outer membrane protein assembly factor BamD n=1 Tax=Marivirga arenosa TaxID=3059076 RepID=A0AA49GCK2_9BACT|nr:MULTISPECIES: outer membrane protein assembly factor BamD [unclassified Marivirga]WKK80005.1 outer membrane protein assembly factor BamD [Marivirga sp. BKB1-2]WKK84944.2 outer membrane protein assembly factor BamD [Marivirga sp. ABR2-2]
MRNSYRNLLFTFIVTILFSSCSDFRKLQKSDDWEKKYDAAINYYDIGEYYKANVLLEQILPIIKGSEKAEIANFYYGYTYFYQEQYLLASHYFKVFYDTFNRSKFAEEARFMFGYSLYKDSPRYNLDQTSSKEAITALQGFINLYPKSKFAQKADEALVDLRDKLERKAYEKALLYYDLKKFMTGEYLKAALVEFGNFQDDFPGSKYTEEIQYLEIEAMYNLAEVSIYSVKKERYLETISFYESFIENYENSKYLKKAEKIYEDCLEKVRKLNS